MISPRLRRIAGWALVLGASGIFIDSWASWSLDAESPEWLVTMVAPGGLGNGSIGLIPAYLGATVGMIGFLIVLHHRVTIPVTVFAGVGVIGMFVFLVQLPGSRDVRRCRQHPDRCGHPRIAELGATRIPTLGRIRSDGHPRTRTARRQLGTGGQLHPPRSCHRRHWRRRALGHQ